MHLLNVQSLIIEELALKMPEQCQSSASYLNSLYLGSCCRDQHTLGSGGCRLLHVLCLRVNLNRRNDLIRGLTESGSSYQPHEYALHDHAVRVNDVQCDEDLQVRIVRLFLLLAKRRNPCLKRNYASRLLVLIKENKPKTWLKVLYHV